MALLLFPFNFYRVFEDVIRRRVERIRRRILRDISNPFTMPESLFIKLYRFPIVLVMEELIPQIAPHIRRSSRSTYIPLHFRVLAALHLLAQGDYQSTVGADNYILAAQCTISKITSEIIRIIAIHIYPNYVKFPTDENEINRIKQKFLEKFNFPNVRGAIDCTHVAIISPKVDDPVQPALAYFNRKGFYSINVQAICDADLIILAVNARFPGATHDSAIWTSSNVKTYLQRKFEQGNTDSWLLGDSGYPLTPYLMTPILDMNNEDPNSPQNRYNYAHIRARNTIERCFGVLKQRFRCILKHRVLHYSHRKAGLMIYACAVLHNILVSNNIPFDEYEDDDDEDESDDDDEDQVNYADPNILAAGRNSRNRIIRRYFS